MRGRRRTIATGSSTRWRRRAVRVCHLGNNDRHDDDRTEQYQVPEAHANAPEERGRNWGGRCRLDLQHAIDFGAVRDDERRAKALRHTSHPKPQHNTSKTARGGLYMFTT